MVNIMLQELHTVATCVVCNIRTRGVRDVTAAIQLLLRRSIHCAFISDFCSILFAVDLSQHVNDQWLQFIVILHTVHMRRSVCQTPSNGQTDRYTTIILSVCLLCSFVAAHSHHGTLIDLFTLMHQGVGINARRWWRNCNLGQCNDNF